MVALGAESRLLVVKEVDSSPGRMLPINRDVPPTRFNGEVATGGDRLPVEVSLDEDELRLNTPHSEIGAWPLTEVQVFPLGNGSFKLSIGGEEAVFVPEQPDAFASALWGAGTIRLRASSSDTGPGPPEDAEEVVLEGTLEGAAARGGGRERETDPPPEEAPRAGPSPPGPGSHPEERGGRWRMVLAVLGLVLGSLGIVVFLAGGGDSAGETPSDPVGPGLSASGTVLPPRQDGSTATTDPAQIDVFALDPVDFIELWNHHGSTVAEGLRIDVPIGPGSFRVEFNSYVALTGAIDGTLTRFSVEVDPSGPATTDRLGIQALGVGVAVASPDLDGPGRADLLLSLGLDVRNPTLDEVGGRLVRNGVVYTLTYGGGLLVLDVEPSNVRER